MTLASMKQKAATILRLNGQGLIEPLNHAEDCVRRCVGIQTQYSQSLPIAVAARTMPKPPEWFAKALEIGGPLRKTWTMRWSLHTVHEDDIPLLVSALGRRFHERFVTQTTKHFGISPADLRKREEKVWKAIREHPLTRKQLHERVTELKGLPGAGWGWDVAGLAYEGRLYISSHHGATTFVAVEPPKLLEEVFAQGELLKRYLKAFQPATRLDMQRWSGLHLSSIDSALEAIANDIEWIRLEEGKDRFAILRGAEEAEQKAQSVQLLAKFDPYVMSHKDKSLYLSDRDYAKVFRPAGQVEACVLMDGVICGTWRAERKGKHMTVRVETFRGFSKRVRERVEREAEGVRIALGAESVECVFA